MPLRTDCWLRRCAPCDVEWDSQPPGNADERAQAEQRGKRLDKIAERYGLGNRNSFLDHAPGNLSSPA